MKNRGSKIKSAALKIVLCVLLVALTAGCLAACNGKGKELPSATPSTWESDLGAVAERVAQAVKLNGGEINFSLTADIGFSDGDKVLLNAGLNYCLNDLDRSVLAVRLTRDDDVLFSVLSNNSTTYIDVVPNEYVGDAKLQILNLGLFDWLNVSYNENTQSGAERAFADMLVNLGKTFFGGVDIESNGNVYVFSFSKQFPEKAVEYFSAVTSALGPTAEAVLLGAFKVRTPLELLYMLPAMEGELAFDFSSAERINVSGRQFTVNGEPAQLSSSFAVSYDTDESLYSLFPADGTGYVQTKIGNSHMTGTIGMYDGATPVVEYEYELNANIDLLKLALNDFDLTALSEDNYLHFKVSHKCDSSCGDFCDSRMGGSLGSVFEIGFSPSDFDSYNIFLSVNLKALLSKEYVASLSGDYGTIGMLALPDYTLFAYPHSSFGKDSVLYKLLLMLYGNNIFNSGAFDVYVNDITDTASEEEQFINEIIGQYVDDGYHRIDRAHFDIEENAYGQARKYNVYNQTVYIIADDVSEVKDYGFEFGALGFWYVLPLDWTFEAPATASDGKTVLTNIYDWRGNLLHGVDVDGNYVPMSPQEAASLSDCYLHADYVRYDKSGTESFNSRIVEVDGLDFGSREVQEVTLRVEYPNPLHSGRINTIFDGVHKSFCVDVKAYIKLTDETAGNSVSFTQGLGDEKFYVTGASAEPPAFLVADVGISYVNGYVKKMRITGECDAVVFSNNLLFQRYYTVETGEVEVVFEVSNKKIVRTYTVQKPDSVEFVIDSSRIGPFNVGDTVYMSNFTNYVKAYAVYNDLPERIGVYLRATDIYINGIPLSESSSDWHSENISDYGSYTVTFLRENNYICKVRKLGYESEAFTVPVRGAQATAPVYQYVVGTTMPEYYFTGVDYRVLGAVFNKTHGETAQGKSVYDFSVTISKGTPVTIGSSGGVRFDNPEIAVGENGKTGFYSSGSATPFAELNEFYIGNIYESVNEVKGVEIPDLVTKPISVTFEFVFKEKGYYRILLTANSESGNNMRQEWLVYVNEL